mmetsp:Transcript_100695/g.323315  ORF Transcript_100695/g.323315 Transcript_100695/m.323315 type:complete len:219 (-) Transcript_100695:64-720(-)|eukprot:CAMPEP_0203899908 /NCGR_PEP_ID=MMETSP0359-20131031/42257_1 /ASSEMBLY_ACC=CAM_ASM_000338 /TAXON_ID=268821 /ORGANISM="Scrippsiella Hangoei, Strain SHTV-5" /LENGTH=218 /DNA_ID=CAMNT_0050823255 /DNA_START=61 /DNA_END=717 /DNA_ORIENTATION=-
MAFFGFALPFSCCGESAMQRVEASVLVAAAPYLQQQPPPDRAATKQPASRASSKALGATFAGRNSMRKQTAEVYMDPCINLADQQANFDGLKPRALSASESVFSDSTHCNSSGSSSSAAGSRDASPSGASGRGSSHSPSSPDISPGMSASEDWIGAGRQGATGMNLRARRKLSGLEVRTDLRPAGGRSLVAKLHACSGPAASGGQRPSRASTREPSHR